MLDINECGEDGKGACEYNCTNTPGSFICGCPQGKTLVDQFQCGIACYTCDKATSNEECSTLEVCQPNQVSNVNIFCLDVGISASTQAKSIICCWKAKFCNHFWLYDIFE